ncbi:MAG: hypothetical protein WAV13_14450 [Thermodesulfovibrionales bacterium]
MQRNGNLVTTIEIKDKSGRVIGTKDVVTYAGLLNLGHDNGLKRIDTQLLQFPSETNDFTAVFAATVETEKGIFKCHGDANPDNVNNRIVPHIIRMAETRAKARALRDAVNIGVVSLEELGLESNGDLARLSSEASNLSSQPENGQNSPPNGSAINGIGRRKRNGRTARKEMPASGGENDRAPSVLSQSEKMTDAQRRYIFRLLAERGIEGDQASQQLLELAGVTAPGEVTRAKASEIIERLLQSPKPAQEVPF